MNAPFYDPGMAKRKYRRTYIKEWRQKKRLSLRKLAARMEVEPGGDQLISHTSLGRIENGQQPYSQPILEALSVALGVPKSALLEIHPDKEGKVIDLVRRLDESKQAEALTFLEFLARK